MALISVTQALDHVLAHAVPLPPEQVPLDDALGRVLAADLEALRTQPPADVSAMDGYAARASDVATAPVELRVIGESGIFTPDDLARLAKAGISTFLVGESLMRQSDVAAATRALLAHHAALTH